MTRIHKTITMSSTKGHIARWLLGASALLGLAALSVPAAARDNVSLSISIGAPAPVYAAPVYAPPVYAPAPAYVSAYVASAPVPVYAGPAYVGVNVPPRVVYYPAPAYGPRWHGHGHGWGHGRHGWR